MGHHGLAQKAVSFSQFLLAFSSRARRQTHGTISAMADPEAHLISAPPLQMLILQAFLQNLITWLRMFREPKSNLHDIVPRTQWWEVFLVPPLC